MHKSQFDIASTDINDKEALNKNRRGILIKEGINEQLHEEHDKCLSSTSTTTLQQSNNTKNIKLFDYSSINIFLKEKNHQNKIQLDNKSPPIKKNLGNEYNINNNNKESLMKNFNQKCNITDDYKEIIPLANNIQHVVESNNKKKSSPEVLNAKTLPDDVEIMMNANDNGLSKCNPKKKFVPNNSGINCLDEKIIERIKNKVKPKNNSGLNSTTTIPQATQETSRTNNNSIFKGADKQILEKIAEKNERMEKFDDKILKRTSLGNIPVYASSPIIFDFKNAEIYADGHETKNSKFSHKNIVVDHVDEKHNEANDSPLKLAAELDAILCETETPLTTPRINTSQTSSTSNIHQVQGISNNNSFIIEDSNINLSRDWIWRQTPTKEQLATSKLKTNLSVLSIESTGDSENYTNNIAEHNISFNTHVSNNSSGFNNSGKIESSPFRIDPSKCIHDGSNEGKLNTNQYSHNSRLQRPSLNITAQKLQQIFPITNPASLNLNQSCINFFSKNSFSDQNSSFSLNNEDASFYESNYSTPQERQQQKFNLQNPNLSLISNNKLDAFYYQNTKNNLIFPQAMPSIPETMTYNNYTPTSSNHGDNTKLLMSIQNQLGSKSSGRLNKKKNSIQDDSLLYDIDINNLDDPKRTTLMIKNIPNKYDRTLILQTIDKNHKGKYDFFYLPIDFKNRCNVGYAFINFIDTKYIKTFYGEFNGKRWEKFNSEKICIIKYARIQGRDALIQHFQFSSVMNQQDKKLKPLILPNQGLSDIE